MSSASSSLRTCVYVLAVTARLRVRRLADPCPRLAAEMLERDPAVPKVVRAERWHARRPARTDRWGGRWFEAASSRPGRPRPRARSTELAVELARSPSSAAHRSRPSFRRRSPACQPKRSTPDGGLSEVDPRAEYGYVRMPLALVCLLLGHRFVGPPEILLGVEVRRCARCGKVA